jgi:hypothetical protein
MGFDAFVGFSKVVDLNGAAWPRNEDSSLEIWMDT